MAEIEGIAPGGNQNNEDIVVLHSVSVPSDSTCSEQNTSNNDIMKDSSLLESGA